MGFEIENGVLKKYEEEAGVTEVIIPEGVTSIGDKAFSGCSNLTIHAPVGSCAEEYAKENNIPFEAL